MSKRKSIDIPGIHHGGAPIPQAAVVRGVLMSGGINGMDRRTGEVAATAEEQVALIFENIDALMAKAGGTLDDIVKIQFFVTDQESKDAINQHWLARFTDPDARPARHTLTYALNSPLLVQAEVTAVIGG